MTYNNVVTLPATRTIVIEDLVIRVPYHELESAIASYLYSAGYIGAHETITLVDLGLEVDEVNTVEVDVTIERTETE